MVHIVMTVVALAWCAGALVGPKRAMRGKLREAATKRLTGGASLSADLLASTVAPTVGCVIANVMYLSALPAVLEARANKTLGTLNPLPWAFIFVNSCGWMHYGHVINNRYTFWSNGLGTLLGLFFTLTAMRLGTDRQRADVEKTLLLFSFVHIAASYVTSYVLQAPQAKQLVAGLTANLLLLIYYAAPLSTLQEVLRTKDAASIFAPLCALNALNGALWLVYGLFVKDAYIWAPNGFGVLLAAVQLAVKAAF